MSSQMSLLLLVLKSWGVLLPFSTIIIRLPTIKNNWRYVKMKCKYCGKEMELDCNEGIGQYAESFYFCECGAECITYENGQEDWWEKDEIDIKKI